MNKRVDYIDVVKGIGIICVVFGHVIKPGIIWYIIYGFHMPLFVFYSGFLHKDNKIVVRIAKILFSYFSMAVFSVLTWFILVQKGNFYYLKQSIYNIIVGGIAPNNGIFPTEALWFILCLIWMVIFQYFLNKMNEKKTKLLILLLFVVFGCIMTFLRNRLNIFFNLDISLMMMPFYFTGYYKKKETDDYNLNILTNLLLIVLFIGICLFNGYVNIYKGNYGKNYLLFLISGFVGIFLTTAFSKNVVIKYPHLKRLLISFGQNSLVIMGAHQFFIYYAKNLGLRLSNNRAFNFLISLMFSWALSLFYKKLRNRRLI